MSQPDGTVHIEDDHFRRAPILQTVNPHPICEDHGLHLLAGDQILYTAGLESGSCWATLRVSIASKREEPPGKSRA